MNQNLTMMLDLQLDKYGTVLNTLDNALLIHEFLQDNVGFACALSLGNMTMYHISFINLAKCIPYNCTYDDGSARGLQINIDRKGSYAIPWVESLLVPSYIAEKWGVGGRDADFLAPFFTTIKNGVKDIDQYKKVQKEIEEYK